MAPRSTVGSRPLIGRTRYLVLAAAVMTYLLITMGGIVCVTESGRGCPDWPGCYGQIIPPMRADAIIEYTHRLIAALTSPTIIVAAIVGWRRFRSIRWLSRPPALAVGFLAMVITLGAVAILRGIPPAIAAVDLGSALMVLALMLAATVVAFSRHANPALPDRLSTRSSFARLTWCALAAEFIVLVSGKLVADSSSIARCLGLPLWSGQLIPGGGHGGLQTAYRLAAGAAGILVVVTVVQAWRTQRTQAAILPAATVLGVLLCAQVMVGALMTTHGSPVLLLALQVATAAGMWATLVVLAVLAGLAPPTRAEEGHEVAQRTGSAAQHARDLLAMTRPIVVALLLAAAYVGMVMGRRAFPPLGLTLRTLLGLALATGGAQAINQYLERDIDGTMTRTAKRPLPAGRIAPAEGLAWGMALCVASLYIVVVFVNGLAAMLMLAGILYYVIPYTMILKRRSAQSTVIGGGAGALLPMTGWAAATGRLDMPVLLLGAIVFLWTPPHFWALALVRIEDYARAGVPTLPVVRGEEFTRGRIMLYASALVVATLLLPLTGITGSLFTVSALVLGGGLLYAAQKVWKQGGSEAAWSLYRASSVYLALLFLALMADALIRASPVP